MSKNESNFKNLLFSEQTLKFEDKFLDTKKIPIPESMTNSKFGIVNLSAIKISQTHQTHQTPQTPQILQTPQISQISQTHEFIFMVDCSGSMSDVCADGRCKIQHITHTLKNIIIYFKENPTIRHHITINAFDDKIYSIVEHQTITEDNFNEIISLIDKIMPKGCTDIELALRSVSETVSDIKKKYPGSTYINIFMTDGEVTAGVSDPIALTELVDKTITNAFIGFGIDHDTVLLNKLCNSTTNTNSGYYFIDKLENAGLVYGEILHGIFYKYLQNVKLEITNGMIYDYRNNNWTNTLLIGNIVSEVNKIYHVISFNPTESNIKLTGFDLISELDIQIIIASSNESENLEKYIYRQRTLQYLYMVNDFINKKNNNKHASNKEIKEEEKNIKNQLREFMNEMKKYMVSFNMDGDKLMKNLCDDIYISYRTFESRFGAMYVNSRQTSQGTQRFYTPTSTPTSTPTNTPISTNQIHKINNIKSLRPPKLTRQVGHTYFPSDDNLFNLDDLQMDETLNENTLANLDLELNLDSELDLNHELSGFEDSPYLTRSANKTMRDISIGTNINYDEEYDYNNDNK